MKKFRISIRKNPFIFLVVFHALILTITHNSTAAEITYKIYVIKNLNISVKKAAAIQIRGNIDQETAKEFEEIYFKLNKRLVPITSVQVFSRGGNIYSALKIARLIYKYGMWTYAPISIEHKGPVVLYCDLLGAVSGVFTNPPNQNCECTSACALIWAAGFNRHGERVGFHRPYLPKNIMKRLTYTEAEVEQKKMFKEIKMFLKTVGFSSDMIRKMLRTSSNEIYFLSKEELRTLQWNPAFREWVLARCGESSKSELALSVKLMTKRYKGEWLSQDEEVTFNLLDQKRRRIGRCSASAAIPLLMRRQGLQ